MFAVSLVGYMLVFCVHTHTHTPLLCFLYCLSTSRVVYENELKYLNDRSLSFSLGSSLLFSFLSSLSVSLFSSVFSTVSLSSRFLYYYPISLFCLLRSASPCVCVTSSLCLTFVLIPTLSAGLVLSPPILSLAISFSLSIFHSLTRHLLLSTTCCRRLSCRQHTYNYSNARIRIDSPTQKSWQDTDCLAMLSAKATSFSPRRFPLRLQTEWRTRRLGLRRTRIISA